MLQSDCVWVTSQYHQYNGLEEFVWVKMGEIMDQENSYHAVELQRYRQCFRDLIISHVEAAQLLRDLQSKRIKTKRENKELIRQW
jgi:hypothetical protein